MSGSTSTPGSGPRADWYPAPEDPALLRYWDGQRWTGHTVPRPPESGDDRWVGYSPGRPAPGPAPDGSPSLVPRWAVVALVAFIAVTALGVVVVMSVVLLAPDEEAAPARSSDASAPPTTPAEAEASVEPATETEPPRSVVPRLIGLSREQAEARLTAAGLEVRGVRRAFSTRPAGTVIGQSRRGGASVLAGTEVAMVVAKPYPRVPGVVGRKRAAAVEELRSAGFKVVVNTETRATGTNGVVLRQAPAGSVRAEPRSLVTIVISSVVRTVAPPANCTPGYSPCLTPASDYDCAGGSGDGPKYTGYVTVTGSDPYDLDADGDGVACEG